MTRLYIRPSVSLFQLGDALTRLTVEDLSIDGEVPQEDGAPDPCDAIFKELRESGADIYMIGCGMMPNITVDWHDGLEGAGSAMMARLGVAVGLAVVTSLVLVF